MEVRANLRSLAPALGLVSLLAAPACRTPDEAASPDAAANGPRLRLAVSQSARPLMELLVEEAAAEDPRLEMEFLPGTHSAGAIAATHTGDADIGVLTRALTPTEGDFRLRYLHMARDGLVFATHSGVGIDNLRSDQIRGIYSGAITNWKELGGEDREIIVLDRPEHTSPKILLRSLLFGQDFPITEHAVVLERPAMMNVSLTSLEGSLGYTSLGEIISSNLDVNVVSLDGISPTPQNVEHGIYPLARFIGLVFRSPPGKEIMRFVDFTYSSAGQRVMTANGYSPSLLNLVIATIPERNVLRQDERYRPLVDYLSERLGGRARVRLQHLASYEMLVEEFATGRSNAAFFGSMTYALARARVPVEPVARPEKAGVSWYRGLIFTRKDTGITEWRDLKGTRFSMIRDTTAGDIFPKVYLRRYGVADVERFFGEIVLAGSHDASVHRVLNGEADAGAAKDLVFRQMEAEDPRIAEELVVIAESLPVPENAFVVRTNIDTSCFSCHQQREEESGPAGTWELSGPAFIARLREELLRLDESPEGRRVLEALGADRFLETTDDDYRNLYDMVGELEIDLSRY